MSLQTVQGQEIATPLHSVDKNLNVGQLAEDLVLGNTTGSSVMTVKTDGSLEVPKGITVAGLKVATKTPSAADDTGTVGEICWDADFLYVCIATDTWTRATIATWGL